MHLLGTLARKKGVASNTVVMLFAMSLYSSAPASTCRLQRLPGSRCQYGPSQEDLLNSKLVNESIYKRIELMDFVHDFLEWYAGHLFTW